MSFVKVDIPKTTKGAAGSPQGKNPMIVVFDWADILTSPARDANGIKMLGDYVFKPNKYAVKLYATSSSISLPRTSEGEEDQVSFSSMPEFTHPGSPLEIEEFIQNMTNRSLGIAVQTGDCDGGESFYKIYGTPCNGLSLIVEGMDNNEALKDLFKFQQFRKSNTLPGRYFGNFTFAEANLVAADAVVIDVAAGAGEYQLQDNAAPTAITDLTNATHGAAYTVLGSGGLNPASVAHGAKFILADGTDWTAQAGSRLTLKAYTVGAGEFVFFEQSRV